MRNIIFSFLALLLLPAYMSGQVIKGKVVDKDGLGVPGAIIIATESKTSADTDFDGNFNINAKIGEVLKISMLGFEAISVTATDGVMNITLSDSKDTELKEVVIIGYGSRKKSDNTGAITQLSSADITKTKVLNATQAIQGKAAGVQVIGTDVPGASPSLIIRGIGTYGADRTPLYVVDGIPTKNINNLNSNDIASFDILKDASSLAIYGNQAANGVVIITTKKGKGDKTSVEYDGFYGVRTPLKTVKMAGSNRFAYYSDVAEQNTRFSTDQRYNTNWFDEITRLGMYSSNNLSLSGSSDKISYLFSLNYYDEKGVLDGLDFNRFTFRNNNDYKLSDKLKITQTFSGSISRSTPKPLSAFTSAYKQSPLVPVRYDNGKWGRPIIGADGQASTVGQVFNNVGNPVADLQFFTEEQKNLLLQGSLALEYKILDDLKFTSRVGLEYNTFKRFSYTPSRELWLAADPTRDAANYSAADPINELVTGRSDYFNWNFDNFLTYNKKFADIHDVEVTLGMSAQEFGSREELEVRGRNVPENSNYWSLNLSSSPANNLVTRHVIGNQRNLIGYFARFQYTLMEKYLFTGTIRRDGSSQFGSDNKWGNFPSFGLGWVLSKEGFLAESKTINFLKLRGGWGRLGNQNVPINQQTFSSGAGLGYDFGGSLYSGTTIGAFIDPTLGWEITEETSVGLDFKALDNKLSGSFDWYDKNTSNVILNVTPPLTVGTGATPAHAGVISNTGFEVALRWDDNINEDLKYWVGANYSNNKNEVSNVFNPLAIRQNGGSINNGQFTKRLEVGQPLGSFYLFEVAGYDANGNFTYFDKDGGITSNPVETDRKFFGSSLPTYYYGMNLGFEYKNIDFSVDTYGVGGNKVYNGKKAQRFGNENIESSIATDFWTASNTNAGNPAPFNTVPLSSDYYLESGAFLRVNNITLGYTVPKITNSISSLRIYASAINPFISQKFTGYSPELNNDGDPMGLQGIELDAYPTLSSFLIGANVKF
ncbi:TonB-linked outer membrane protein, SusC/RagA family [Flavobacterium fryxellicola]|uniref:SusC/RagA family TonB-linked outer membrane protein n=1 Tax=Flavobacterium fryxellicola TaxID=249352 RepID=A0A167YUA5_9FLAO|nr:SusC/RagA family TonB-linked outer membrane protein [Flavobacterium fryxellicola]OAB29795.1 SusC/RagA family TonB-linked outer membrane protein [Flavobacterium fryxellicola]SHN73093.1 TonB-linked outer membrane protein, SusC/RagA family [Flavobacterium fryxellicola]